MITQQELKYYLDYNPNTGDFIWKDKVPRMKCGSVAGSMNTGGYIQIRIKRKLYTAHRLVFLYMTGKWPGKYIDHINKIRNDNRWTNLRECTNAENCQNRTLNSNNTSKYTGVSYHKASGKWAARINKDYVTHNLGLYDNPYEAFLAYKNAKMKYHTFHPVP